MCHDVTKTIPLLKSHEGRLKFEACVDTIKAEFQDVIRPGTEYKFLVCGPKVVPDSLYHFLGPDNECRRWVQEVNSTEGAPPALPPVFHEHIPLLADSVAFVVARCTTQPSVTLRMLPESESFDSVNFEGSK